MNWLQTVLVADLRREQKQFQRNLMGLKVETLSGDHTHKTATRVKHFGGRPVFGACYTLITQYGQCRGCSLTYGTSHAELVPTFQGLCMTCIALGYSVKAFWSDDVKKDKAFLASAVRFAGQPLPPMPNPDQLPRYSLPAPLEVRCLCCSRVCASFCLCMSSFALAETNVSCVLSLRSPDSRPWSYPPHLCATPRMW